MLEDAAARAREQHEAERAEEREIDRPLDLRERGRLGGADRLLEQARRSSRLARERRGGAPGIDEAEQRQHGQQDRGREQQRPHARIPRPQAQPEVDADAPVRPGDEQDDALAQAEIGPDVPEGERHARVGIDLAIQQIGQACAHDVAGEQHGDREPERELRRLPCGHPPGAPPVDRPERHRDVDEEGAVERDGAERAAPEREEPEPSRFHGVDRHEAERVVHQMGRDVGEQDTARPEPESAAPSLHPCWALAHRWVGARGDHRAIAGLPERTPRRGGLIARRGEAQCAVFLDTCRSGALHSVQSLMLLDRLHGHPFNSLAHHASGWRRSLTACNHGSPRPVPSSRRSPWTMSAVATS